MTVAACSTENQGVRLSCPILTSGEEEKGSKGKSKGKHEDRDDEKKGKGKGSSAAFTDLRSRSGRCCALEDGVIYGVPMDLEMALNHGIPQNDHWIISIFPIFCKHNSQWVISIFPMFDHHKLEGWHIFETRHNHDSALPLLRPRDIQRPKMVRYPRGDIPMIYPFNVWVIVRFRWYCVFYTHHYLYIYIFVDRFE